MRRPRLLLADDHTLVVEGLKKLLENDFELVGTAEDGRALLAKAEELKPDVVLLDISMPLLNGIDAARQLSRKAPRMKIIFLTMHADAAYVTAAFRAGASGYLLKRSAAGELVRAIREVLNGCYYVTPLVTKDVLKPLLTPGPARRQRFTLTVRQREVLQLVAEGRSMKEIASILHVSVKTVEFHKSRIAQVLGLRTTAEMTRYALENGIIESGLAKKAGDVSSGY
jgi:DNA-binding NarL/FixJ family response regulator